MPSLRLDYPGGAEDRQFIASKGELALGSVFYRLGMALIWSVEVLFGKAPLKNTSKNYGRFALPGHG
jgi:hypothetical protein